MSGDAVLEVAAKAFHAALDPLAMGLTTPADWVDEAAAVVAAVRPLIEAEVWRQALQESAEVGGKLATEPAHVWALAAWDYGTKLKLRAKWIEDVL